MSDTVDCVVLCVCTGNICRSPAAQRVLGRRLGPSVRVESAGTRAMVGWSIFGPMTARLREAGYPPERFAARQVHEPMVLAAQLVLTMSRTQLTEVERLAPGCGTGRSFTLLEFARLIEPFRPDELSGSTPGERLRSAVPLVDALRGSSRGRDDIADPYGGSTRAYQRAFAEIDRAADTVAVAVGALAERQISWD